MMKQFLFAVLVMSCAKPIEVTDAEVITDLVASAPIGEYFDDCSRAFSPDEASLPYAEEAVDRWSVVTDCDIHIADGGIPITYVENLIAPDGHRVYGAMYSNSDEDCRAIEISPFSPHLYDTATHEVGHCLSNKTSLDPDNHSLTGVMSNPMVSPEINKESLSIICSGLPCLNPHPELP